MNQIPAVREVEDDKHCLQISKHFLYITFTLDDMQIKGKQDELPYYTGYIRSSEMSRIQVVPGSALSIMLCRVMQHLGILGHRLSATQIAIHGFNANGTRSMDKIKLKCQIGAKSQR